jgi:hypothetical protein
MLKMQCKTMQMIGNLNCNKYSVMSITHPVPRWWPNIDSEDSSATHNLANVC